MNKDLRTLRNMSATRRGWYDIQNRATGPTQVLLYSDIGDYGITANDFADDLRKISGDIEVHINSQGGNVFEGITIYSALSQRPGKVSVVVDGLAASISSVIAMAASEGELSMTPNASMMVHEAHTVEAGFSADLREMADLLDKTSENIASIYAARSGATADQWREVMRGNNGNGTWFSAQEALNAGLADSILQGRSPHNQAHFEPENQAHLEARTQEDSPALSADDQMIYQIQATLKEVLTNEG